MALATVPPKPASTPVFWRDERLAFIEARYVEDGRHVCYARHAHDFFSIGAITAGESTYINGAANERVSAGTVVLINPEDVHACNPIDDRPWSYIMLYVDVHWLAQVQQAFGTHQSRAFRPFPTHMTTEPEIFAGVNRLYTVLIDEQTNPADKESAARAFFCAVQSMLGDTEATPTEQSNPKLAKAAQYIRSNFTRPVKLEEICEAAELSSSYLIRAFKERYGMTPHAYLVNCRVEYSRSQLKRGRAIADVAVEAGFADQAHLQRAFRQFTAVTPRQYRG